MNYCVGGVKHRYVVDKLVILLIWPMQKRTNLSHNEVKALGEVGFVINKQQPILPRNLFARESFVPINRPIDVMSWPKTRNGKPVRHTQPFIMSKLHYNRWETSQLLVATF